jgi:hypothetical protein
VTLLASDWLASLGFPAADRELELPAGASLADAGAAAGLPLDEVGIWVRNGAKAEAGEALAPGDRIKALPWVIGG